MNGHWMLFLAMLAGGVLTFASRAVFLLGGQHLTPGPRLRALLEYVPAAVLSALIAPEVFIAHGELNFSPHNPRLWAALAAGLVALRFRSVLATIAVGLLVLWGIQSL